MTTLLLDEVMPVFDATRVEHRVVDAPLDTTWAAMLDADLVEAGRRHGLVAGVFALRSAAEHVVAAVRRTEVTPTLDAPTLRLADLPSHGDWVRLAADPPHELAFGVIGRFWGGTTTWEQIDAGAFADFDRPGFAKIAASLSLRPYGEQRTLLTYEARTRATDESARRAFLRYWRVVSPGVGLVLRAVLALIAATATRS